MPIHVQVWENLTDFSDERITQALGFIPTFLREDSKLSARAQIDLNYAHGGGWQPCDIGWMLNLDNMTLTFPGDPPYKPLAKTRIHGEEVYVYQYAWVVIIDQAGNWEVARLD